MGFNLKKLTPNVGKADLAGLFASALCDAQFAKYCFQSFQCLPANTSRGIADILALQEGLNWPTVSHTATELLCELSTKILVGLNGDSRRRWQPHHERIKSLKVNVEAKDVIETCNSYTALYLLLNQIVVDAKSFPSPDEMLDGMLRCSAWLSDGFITSLFLLFNIVFMSTVGEALDEHEKRKRMAQNQESAANRRARESQLSRVKSSKTNAEATNAASELSGLFDKIDTNHDGKLNADELCRGLRMINPDGNW